MKARPAMYKDVLVIGGGSLKVEGPPVARIGGIWVQPNLGLSYLLAARYVIEAGTRDRCQNEVALPAAYLQRHAFEIGLKDLIESALIIKADEGWLSALRKNRKARRPPVAEVPYEHDLRKLIKLLGRALADAGFGAVPVDIIEMGKRLREVEMRVPDRLRYSTVRSGKSFPIAVLLHVGKTQELLEGLFEKLLVYEEHGSNLMTELAHEGIALDQAILDYVPISKR